MSSNTTSASVDSEKDRTFEVMKKIEKEMENKVNSKYRNGILGILGSSGSENAKADRLVKEIVNDMKKGGDEFEQQMGRKMTYSEMRQMYG